MGNNRAKRQNDGCRFFFVQPRNNNDVGVTARRLIEMEHIKEVHVTTGDFGFVVRADVDEVSAEAIQRKIMKLTDGKMSSVASCMKYIK